MIGLERKLFTVDEYERMIVSGVFEPDERVELIGGEIVKMTPIGLRHMACVIGLTRLLQERCGRAALVSVQNPIYALPDSMPEPDLALLKERSDLYATRRPAREDILLLIEVSDTTLHTDLSTKAPLYARAGIALVWVVDLEHDRVEVYSQPVEGAYTSVVSVQRGGMLDLPGGFGQVEASDVLV